MKSQLNEPEDLSDNENNEDNESYIKFIVCDGKEDITVHIANKKDIPYLTTLICNICFGSLLEPALNILETEARNHDLTQEELYQMIYIVQESSREFQERMKENFTPKIKANKPVVSPLQVFKGQSNASKPDSR